MREIELVERIRKFARTDSAAKSIIRSVGDDCAILRPDNRSDLVFTTDFLIEGRHFSLDTHKAADVGHKALARSLSDLAAMGSRPVFCLLSLAIPASRTGRWLDGFYRGFLQLAGRHSITLAGGDLSKSDTVIADVMCCGRVPRGHAILRSGARPGDFIYVTGELGGSAHGLAVRRGAAWRRHLRPEPRIDAGIALQRRVSAGMDLSDGLSLDLHRLCLESQVAAEITSQLPFAKGATLSEALDGGEDYELLVTVSPKRRLPKTIGSLPLTRIGTIVRGMPGQVKLDGRILPPGGFEHF